MTMHGGHSSSICVVIIERLCVFDCLMCMCDATACTYPLMHFSDVYIKHLGCRQLCMAAVAVTGLGGGSVEALTSTEKPILHMPVLVWMSKSTLLYTPHHHTHHTKHIRHSLYLFCNWRSPSLLNTRNAALKTLTDEYPTSPWA